MPIAKIELPDGRIARFEVPQGTTQQQVLDYASQNLSQFEQPQATSSEEMSRGEAAFATATNPLGMGPRIKAGLAAGYAKGFGGDVTADIPFEELYKEQLKVEEDKIREI